MNTVIATGKTVEDAIARALRQLGASREQVTFRVLEEPSKGFFGLIGVREAKVEVTIVEHEQPKQKQPVGIPVVKAEVQETKQEEKQPAAAMQSDAAEAVSSDFTKKDAFEEGRKFLEEILQTMELDARVEEVTKDGTRVLTIAGEGMGLIIGRHGQTLDSLQYLVNIVANRYSDKRIHIVVDAENYRAKRRESLQQMAERLARQVSQSRRSVRLEPMSATERKIIHSYLQGRGGIETHSEGTEPNRYVVIGYKRK
ncbi:protein jag [Aneurinibacillus sp. Ricciae_BoGa-3]|uniref:RNA-binding cell elongation regulator Jag/EloR n=1 Tax=Aneurinibacillus sp. Ricciae_BoGa-3 TaxID=3022697 RepID=UPI0023423337|nr:RNA-binding cell elongation regulator Jag/EloR [Aneurinibacillus sp. Ricciae_BoGa-3]WCK54522.1 protein jag [Aneurinibacillus sp. Ricciae_BoGa-3]